MDVIERRRIRCAIQDVLEGNLGPVRLEAGVFLRGVHAGLPIDKLKSICKSEDARHRYDIVFGGLGQHGSSPVMNIGSREIALQPVTIQCWTHKRSTLDPDERDEVLDQLHADADDARQALSRMRALFTTLSGDATILCGDAMMVGPGGVTSAPDMTAPQEDWENSLVTWSLVGALYLDIPQRENS